MKRVFVLATLVAGATAVLSLPAGADPVSAGSASAFAASVSVGGTEVVPPTPLAEVSLPPGGEVSETTVDVPADPVAVNGTLNADVAAHAASDLESALTVETQAVDGPYNVQAVALIEGAEVLLDAAGDGVSLVSAAAVRSEAVAVCRGGSVQYSANSEIIDLDAGGEDIPANAPVTELVDAISGALADAGLDAVVDVRRNVVTQLDGGGIAVDALVLSAVADGGPLALVTIGHAEVGAATCGAGGAGGAPTTPACSDGVDNGDAEDTLADADDPGCHSDGDATNAGSYDPDDTDETDDGDGGGSGTGIGLECADGVDNDDPEDELADIDDPGCHTDGDASNVLSYDPTRASEVDETGGGEAGGPGAGEPGDGGGGAAGDPGDGGTGSGTLPQTGGNEAATALTAAALGAAGLGLHLVRRRLSVQ